MDMFNEQQDAANSPGGVAPSGDQHTDSPENSGGGESTPIQFLLNDRPKVTTVYRCEVGEGI